MAYFLNRKPCSVDGDMHVREHVGIRLGCMIVSRLEACALLNGILLEPQAVVCVRIEMYVRMYVFMRRVIKHTHTCIYMCVDVC